MSNKFIGVQLLCFAVDMSIIIMLSKLKMSSHFERRTL